jgi:molybdopterin converting factor subunit 1
MNLRIQLFARLRDLAGTDTISVTLPEGASVADLRKCIVEDHPGLARLLDRCAVACNNEFAEANQVLSPGDEIALLPPVSGGAR